MDHEEVFGELQLERGRTSLLRLLFGLDSSQVVTCTKCTYTEWSSTQDYRLNIQALGFDLRWTNLIFLTVDVERRLGNDRNFGTLL